MIEMGLQHWLAVHTGTVNEPGPYYGFWSGFGSDLGELTILGAVIGMYRKHNCHEPRCWRLGKHQVEGTPYTACRKHHPELNTLGDVVAGHMTTAWRAAKDKAAEVADTVPGLPDRDDESTSVERHTGT